MPDATLAQKIEPTHEITAEQAPVQPWERMPNEPILWFKRFQTYRLLGPKRSLQLAVELSDMDVKVLKGTKKAANEQGIQEPDKNGQKRTSQLEVVKPSVPGSWKRASMMWHWQERAKAWDENFIQTQAESMYNKLVGEDKYFLACDRIKQLAWMYQIAKGQIKEGVTHADLQKYLARMDTLLLRIREESQLVDEMVTKHILAKRQRDIYESLTFEEYIGAMTRGSEKELQRRGKQSGK